MNASSRVDVIETIDSARLSPFQWRLFILLFAVAAADGLDTQSIAFVAPAISKELGLHAGAFGPIFSVGLLGTAVGAVALGMLADRVGRRWPIIGSTLLFAIATAACAFAPSYDALLVCRLIAGIGLGGAVNNSLSLASEYSPQRIRSTVVTVCLWGFPLGAMLGGIFAGALITGYGWRSVFYAGAVLPLLLTPILLGSLPESIRFLMLDRETHSAVIARLLTRISPSGRFTPSDDFHLTESCPPRGTPASLFRSGLAAGTVLMWTAVFFSCFMIYCLVNWIPSVLHGAGIEIRIAAWGTAAFNLAGVVGSYTFSRFTRVNPLRVVAISYFAGAVAVIAVGLGSHATAVVLAAIFVTGFFIIGAQIALTAFATNFYPTSIRSTGIGWYQAVSRLGSMMGPFAGGLILAGSESSRMFVLCAVPAVCAGVAICVLTMVNAGARERAADGALSNVSVNP